MNPDSLPSGPRGRLLPTLRLLKDPLRYYRDLFRQHGDPVLIRAMNGEIVLTADPDGAREVIQGRPDSYAPFATQALAPLVGAHSLLTLGGSEHRRQRKLIMPAFHGQRMKQYAQTMVDATDRAFDSLTPGSQFVALEKSSELALDVIIRAVFGIDQDDQVAATRRAINDTTASLKPIFFFSRKFQVAPFGLGPWATFQTAAGRLDALLFERIAAARSGTGGEDILSMLLEARDEDGGAMTDQELRDELVTLLVAGHETSSIGIAWGLYHLHRHPDALDAFREEVTAHGDGPLDEIPRLPYVRATVQELLRLFPIIPDFIRELTQPMQFRGLEIPAGHCVGVASTVMHHDPDIYDEPMQFRPSRFLDEIPPKWAYFPFGAGHRRCVGAAFAEFQIGLVLSRLLSRHEFELREPEQLYPVRRNVTMAPPTGVRLVLCSRL